MKCNFVVYFYSTERLNVEKPSQLISESNGGPPNQDLFLVFFIWLETNELLDCASLDLQQIRCAI
jgi:hypothetical protein